MTWLIKKMSKAIAVVQHFRTSQIPIPEAKSCTFKFIFHLQLKNLSVDTLQLLQFCNIESLSVENSKITFFEHFRTFRNLEFQLQFLIFRLSNRGVNPHICITQDTNYAARRGLSQKN